MSSIIVHLLVGFAFYILFNVIFGRYKSDVSRPSVSSDNSDKDIERLREIAEYDRWEKNRPKDS